MKPRAPLITTTTAQPSLHTEIARICDVKANDARLTVPSPPSDDALRAATPLPLEAPTEPPPGAATTPAPPPTSLVIVAGEDDEDPARATHPAIPPPPRLPKVG
jgi:hypothetical protein